MNEQNDLINAVDEQVLLIRNTVDQARPDSWIDLNLTISQLKSLMYIDYHTNVSVKDLAGVLKMAQPNTTKLADLLIKKGLVSRKENPRDRRLLLLNTTAKGKKLLTTLRNSYAGELSNYLKLLSPEQLLSLYDGLAPLTKILQEKRTSQDYRKNII